MSKTMIAVLFAVTHTLSQPESGRLTGPASTLSVRGSYPTKVSLIRDRNTCGPVTVQDNVTTVAHTTGAHTLSMTHVGNTYEGTVDDSGHFQTKPRVLAGGDSGEFTITIDGRFTRVGFDATVRIDVKRSTPPQTCAYAVHWVGTKDGPPNTIPSRDGVGLGPSASVAEPIARRSSSVIARWAHPSAAGVSGPRHFTRFSANVPTAMG